MSCNTSREPTDNLPRDCQTSDQLKVNFIKIERLPYYLKYCYVLDKAGAWVRAPMDLLPLLLPGAGRFLRRVPRVRRRPGGGAQDRPRLRQLSSLRLTPRKLPGPGHHPSARHFQANPPALSPPRVRTNYRHEKKHSRGAPCQV